MSELDPVAGAVDLETCPNFRRGRGLEHCKCGLCAKCGQPKHMAVHGPFFGQPPGSKPFKCEYTPALIRTEIIDKQFPLDGDQGVPLSMAGFHEVDMGMFCAPDLFACPKPPDTIYDPTPKCTCAGVMVIAGEQYYGRNAGCKIHSENAGSKWIEQTHLEKNLAVVQPTSGKRR